MSTIKITYSPDQTAYRYDLNGWIFAHIEGDPETRGYNHGYLLAREIAEYVSQERELIYIQTGMKWDFFRDNADKLWSSHMDAENFREFRDELQGIANGLKAANSDTDITYKDLLAWNGYEELTDYWFPTVAKSEYDKMGPMTGQTFKSFCVGAQDRCSAFIATGSYTKDGIIVAAHNSFSPFETGGYINAILEIEPKNGLKFIMQTQPGYLHSMTDFYENSAKLLITETTIGGFNAYNADGIPEFLRIRRAAQYADSLDSFFNILWEGNNGGYANTWLVGDCKTKEIMRLEMGLKFYQDDRTKDGAFAGFNAPLDPRIRNFECSNSGFSDIRRHQGSRQVRIPQLLEKHKGKINNEIAQEIIADHYDVYLNKDNCPSSRTVCAHYELDDRASMSQPGRPVPYQPRGAVDGVTATSADVENLSFWGRFGSSCGAEFNADTFFKNNPQFDYLRPFIKTRPSQPWTLFPAK